MNARRRSLEKWQDLDSKNSSMIDSSSPHSSVGQSDAGITMNSTEELAAAQASGDSLKAEEYAQQNAVAAAAA